MANSCAIIPRVKNNKGEVVESRLFKDLLSYTSDRNETKRIYLITKSDNFIQTWNPRLDLDENNEPTFRSLFDKTNLKEYISEEKILERLNMEVGRPPAPARPKWYINEPDVKKDLNQRVI